MTSLNSSILIVLFAFILNSCRRPPSSYFTPGDTTVKTGESIQFHNDSKRAHSYEWDFGDGTTSTEEEPLYAYAEPGDYQVSLTAISKNGNASSTRKATITVVASQLYLDIKEEETKLITTWQLDSINIDANDGSFHSSTPTTNLWGGTTSYVQEYNSDKTVSSFRDGVEENSTTWSFQTPSILTFGGSQNVNILTLDLDKFSYEHPSSADPANYTESWYFTKQ